MSFEEKGCKFCRSFSKQKKGNLSFENGVAEKASSSEDLDLSNRSHIGMLCVCISRKTSLHIVQQYAQVFISIGNCQHLRGNVE